MKRYSSILHTIVDRSRSDSDWRHEAISTDNRRHLKATVRRERNGMRGMLGTAALLFPVLVALPISQAAPAQAAAAHSLTSPSYSAAGIGTAASKLPTIAKRHLFSHKFLVHGRVTRPNPFTTKQARAFGHKIHQTNPKRVAVFGRVVSQSTGRLVIRQIPWQAHGTRQAKVAFSDTTTPAGHGAALIPVHITSRTLVQSLGGLAAIRKGMPVFGGGGVSNRVFSAYIISTLNKASSGNLSIVRALSGQLVHAARFQMTPPARRLSPLDTSENFTGEFGGPSFNYNNDFKDIDIFDVGIFSVYLSKFSFLASLDGWTYNWPMNFTGSTASPLIMTEQNSVNLNVLPQHGAGTGTYTDTFSGGIGVDVGIGFHIYTAVGCGDIYLDSCDFYPTLHLGVGLLNETQAPAPLASGQDLNVPTAECPNVGFDIPDTDISGGDVGICNTFLIHGSNFQAHVSATGADMAPADLSFDGTNGHSLNLTPTTTPVDVTLNNFLWNPTLDYGLHPRIRIAKVTVWSGPSVILVSGSFPMIADAATRSAEGFNDVVGQFSQPTSADLPFPATKETTHIASTGPTSGDYHDAATMSATLTDNLGRVLPNKPLRFVLNGSSTEACQATTNALGSASCAITPTDPAGSGSLAITFNEDPQYFATSSTPAFTILHEETTLAYTGDPLIANNRSAVLKGVLKEDGAVAPVPAGQSIVFTLGTGSAAQSCTGTTDSTGLAQCTIATVNQPLGTGGVAAAFSGDAYYVQSSDSQQRLVFSYLGDGGSFALGDNTVAGASATSTVYFWGSQWASRNSLSGGAAPTSFKGFVQNFTPSGDPTCGSTWTTGTGNSPSPPATVPSYLAVVVPDKVTQMSSTVWSGDTKKIVIVKTNPGYGPDPSLTGTGTIVATLCSR